MTGAIIADAGGRDVRSPLARYEAERLLADRERLRQLRLHVLEAQAGRLSADGRYGLALETALTALRADPLRESAHRTIIGIHLAEGNVAESHRAVDACGRTLRHDGLEPSNAVRPDRAVGRESLTCCPTAG